MDPYYKNILSSGEVTPSDPATRKPLVFSDRGASIRKEENKSRTCNLCKWGAPDATVPEKGKCMAMKNKLGAIWQRAIADYYGMSCDLFDEGEIDFRQHV
jgi:hypothetical protein